MFKGNTINTIKTNADFLGILASTLCLVHCVVTPLLFIWQADGAFSDNAFWHLIEPLCFLLSGIAVYWTIKNTTKNWLKYAMAASWVLLAFLIINEKVALISLADGLIYLPTLSLIGLHFYNRQYCRCNKTSCCAKA